MYEITFRIIIEAHKWSMNKKAKLTLNQDFPTMEDLPQMEI